MGNHFENLIGQQQAKTRLSFYLEGFERTGIFPNLLLIAQKGDGKTTFARHTAQALKDMEEEKRITRLFAEVNCASIDDSETFIERLIRACRHQSHATFFFDELHSMPSDVVDWLLTALESGNDINEVTYKGEIVKVNFRQITFIAATTEPQKVFLPLLNRFRILELPNYQPDELAEIVTLKCSTPLREDARASLVTLGRGNARSIVDLAQEVDRYAKINDLLEFSLDDLNELIKILDIFPLGLSRNEVHSLLTLRERREMSLTAFCAVSGLTRAAQQNAEGYLLRHGLIEITSNSKRVLTTAGKQYLNRVSIQSPENDSSIL